MTDTVRLERRLPGSAARVFRMVTAPDQVFRWWGHDDMTLPDHNLDFTRPGRWFAVLEDSGGRKRMVSGEVLEVDPPRFVAFTWAWHEGGPGGPRGTETRVTIEIHPEGETAATLVLSHFDLGTDSARAGHGKGWLSILDKLEIGLRDAARH